MAGGTHRLHFDLEWRITLFTLVLLPVFIGLGFWQLDRAQEKKALADTWEERRRQPPSPLAGLQHSAPVELAYRPVQLRGEFLREQYFLLDNRIHQGRYGHEVLGVMRLEGSDLLALVNRGWVAADPARRELPEVPVVSGMISLRGHIYVPPGQPYLLGEQVLQQGWPKRIQAVDTELVEAALGAEFAGGDSARILFPYVIRVDGDQPAALLVDWQVINVSPAKHRGYALQWFTMALALAIIYTLRSSNLWQVLVRSRRRSD